MSTPTDNMVFTPKTTLLSSLITYPLLFYLITPRNAIPSRFTKSREALSILHATTVTLLSAYAIHRQSPNWTNLNLTLSPSATSPPPISLSASTIFSRSSATLIQHSPSPPLITTRSALGNSIAALEFGYLVQDAVVLIAAARRRARSSGRPFSKEINWTILVLHHGGLVSALALLQVYVARGREKGMMIVLMLMLMNAS